jgi:hypothetical protein
VSLTLLASAVIIAVASFVMGLAGFGIGLVALAFLPWVMSPVVAIIVTTIYSMVFSIVMIWPLRHEIEPVRLSLMLAGTLVGAPLGVWGLAAMPVALISRLIGIVLILVVVLEWSRFSPRLAAPGWGLGAGVLAGALGGAIGTPGPPVVIYATAQGWSPRAVKANLLAFFIVNQGVTLIGYWWVNLLTPEVWRLTFVLAAPALAGTVAGVMAFNRIDAVRFRQVVYGVLLVSGVVLLLKG